MNKQSHQLEQALSLHDGHAPVTLGNLGGAACALLILLNTDLLPHTVVILWFGAFTLYTGLLWCKRVRVLSKNLSETDFQQHWLRFSMLSMGALGLLWSAIYVPIMLCSQSAYQLAALAGGAMLGAGAMASLGPHLPSYRAFFLCMFLPLVVVLLLQSSWFSFGMGIAAVLFLFFMLWSGERFNASYMESLRLRDEKVALVAELRVQKEAAEQAGLAKSRFLASASHDMRQPMYSLNLYHGALANLALTTEAASLLANAQQCALAMDAMFAGLLDMSRIDAGVVDPSECSFPVAAMLERLRIEFTPAVLEKGLSLHVVHSSALIHTDPALAERILRNLLMNAVRYTFHGRITVGCRRRGDRVRVVVADTGIGIPADKLSFIFEEYVQLGNPERDRAKGLGLGLAIVRRLGLLLGTAVEVSSILGKGSVFWVDFVNSVSTEVNSVSSAPLDGDLNSRWVIVIDDESMIRDATRTLLSQWGCEVTLASSGDEAVELLAMSQRVPSAILCDYRLRDEEYGLDAIEKLRMEFCEDIPAILITGDTAPDRIAEIKSSGIPILHKPLQAQTLRQALLEITNGR
jgi:two-component system, sensor histidine kinase